MDDRWINSIIFQEEYLLFESPETGMFYWLMFSKEFVFRDPFSKIFQVYESQDFKTMKIAIEACKDRTLRLTLQ